MMTNIVDCPQTPEALQLDMPLEVTFEKQSDDDHPALLQAGRPSDVRQPMKPKSVAVVGAAETTEMGVIPGHVA